MPVPVYIELINKDSLFIKFSDNIEGTISLKKIVNIESEKNINILIHPETNNIIIGTMELCKDAIYKQLYLKNQLLRLKIDPLKL